MVKLSELIKEARVEREITHHLVTGTDMVQHVVVNRYVLDSAVYTQAIDVDTDAHVKFTRCLWPGPRYA